MNKEELKKICFKWLWKAFETGTKQDPFSADNSEYWHPAIDLDWSKRMMEEIQQYAEQEKREVAKEQRLCCQANQDAGFPAIEAKLVTDMEI